MPTDTKVGNPKVNPKTGKPGNPAAQKGKPLGIPKWGWIVGIALGLVIGYLVLRHSSGSNTSDSGTGADSSPLGNSDSGTGGGASSSSPTSSPDVLSAQGITNNGSSDPSTVQGQGDSFTSLLAGATPFSGQQSAAGIANEVSVPTGPTNHVANTPQGQTAFGSPGITASPPPSSSPGGNARTPGAQM